MCQEALNSIVEKAVTLLKSFILAQIDANENIIINKKKEKGKIALEMGNSLLVYQLENLMILMK